MLNVGENSHLVGDPPIATHGSALGANEEVAVFTWSSSTPPRLDLTRDLFERVLSV